MSFELEISPGDNLVTVSLMDSITLEDVVSAYEAMLEHPRFQPGMHALWDVRMSELHYNPQGIQAVVNHVHLRQGVRGHDYRVALVTHPTRQRAEAIVFKALAAVLPVKIQIFSELVPAQKWIVQGDKPDDA